MFLLCLALPGCRGCDDIDARYGRRRGAGAAASVNGTAVLGEMFEGAGHRLSTAMSLSPRVKQKADCIVWFPDSFQAPSQAACDWFDQWLNERPGRTLVYVGRGYDAAGAYWRKVGPQAPPEQKNEVARRRQEADAAFARAKGASGGTARCDLFTIESLARPRQVRTLQGAPSWLDEIDPARVEIDLDERIVLPAGAEALLESEEDVIVSREYWDRGQVIVVANGSFLLNLPLVNHEHRKLAGRLIDEIGPPPRAVVFLESGPMGPRVLDEDPATKVPTGLEIFHEWPANWILLHLSLVGILYCFWRLPIFGRARPADPAALSDFGRHVEALGDLLEQSRDRVYAMTRLVHYQQSVKPKE